MLLDIITRHQIFDLYLAGKKSPAAPCAWFMCGLPGSGKTSFVRRGLKEGLLPQSAFLMDPDGVMENIQGYQRHLKEKGAEAAFSTWEMTARTLAYDMLHEARNRKLDIIVDMGHALPESRRVIEDLKQGGYKTVMYYINCPTDICRERVAHRARYLPPELIIQRNEMLGQNLDYFRMIMDEFEEIDGLSGLKQALTS